MVYLYSGTLVIYIYNTCNMFFCIYYWTLILNPRFKLQFMRLCFIIHVYGEAPTICISWQTRFVILTTGQTSTSALLFINCFFTVWRRIWFTVYTRQRCEWLVQVPPIERDRLHRLLYIYIYTLIFMKLTIDLPKAYVRRASYFAIKKVSSI